jgi:hypothetical protein
LPRDSALHRLPAGGKPIDGDGVLIGSEANSDRRASRWWQLNLPTVTRLPDDVWTARHRLIRGVVWAYALLLPTMGAVLDWQPWVVLLSGLLPAAAAALAGFPNRRVASMAATCGLLLPSVFLAHFNGTPDYAVQFHWLASLIVAWLYRDPLLFPIAMGIVLVTFGIHEEPVRALAETGIVLVMAATSLASWAQHEAKSLRRSIAEPEAISALAREFKIASEQVGLEERQANVVLSLAILRMLQKT